MNNILITGGAGFIGSHFVEYLKQQNHPYDKVIVLDKLTYAGNLDRIRSVLDDDFIFIHGDICNRAVLEEIFKSYQVKTVVNFAAESHVDRSIEDVFPFIQTNYIGVQILMDTFKSNWQNEGRFIQISTDEVFGSSKEINLNKNNETSLLNPMNPYAATKASAELLINSYNNTYDFPSIIIRSTNNYGGLQNEEKLIPKVIQAVLNQRDIPIYGNGEYYRDWLHVTNTCEAIYQVTLKSKIQESYNIAGTGLISNIDLIQMIICLFKEAGHDYHGQLQFVKDRPGHDYCYLVDDKKYLSEFKMKKISLNTGLKQLIDSVLNT
ncbi:MAG: GDP-mannose 4,6-dehydratase [Clostridiales bacterium]|nr:GDP-mannose 4,6-dehydratase [Clostridiales bacterium]